MSTTRNRNLLIIIGVLLLTNVAVLVYFLGQKRNNKLQWRSASSEPQL